MGIEFEKMAMREHIVRTFQFGQSDYAHVHPCVVERKSTFLAKCGLLFSNCRGAASSFFFKLFNLN